MATSHGNSRVVAKQDPDGAETVTMVDNKAPIKSYKDKYLKMKFKFDRKMHESEELHKLEQKAIDTARRLAIQNDRILDLLLDVNGSDQIPLTKRIDMDADPPGDEDTIEIEEGRPAKKPRTYKGLLRDTRHVDFDKTVAENSAPQLLRDLDVTPWEGAEASTEGKKEKAVASGPNDGKAAKRGAIPKPQPLPAPSFVTPDALDDYIYAVDLEIRDAILAQTGQVHEIVSRNGHHVFELADTSHPIGSMLLPTLAPSAKGTAHGTAGGAGMPTTNGLGSANAHGSSNGIMTNGVSSGRNLALHNPTSTYNWLRKHAPNTLTSDSIDAGTKGDDDDEDEEDGHGHQHSQRGNARKSAAMSAAARRRSQRDEDGNILLRADGRPLTGPGSRGGKGSRGGRVRAASGDNRRSSAGGERTGRAKRVSTSRAAVADSSMLDNTLASLDEEREGSTLPPAAAAAGDDDGDGDSTIAAFDSAAATPSSVGGGGGRRGGSVAAAAAAAKRKRTASAADDDAGYNPRSGTRKRARKSSIHQPTGRLHVTSTHRADDDADGEAAAEHHRDHRDHHANPRPKTGRGSRGGRGAGSRRGGRRSNMAGERIVFDRAGAASDDDDDGHVKKEPVDDDEDDHTADVVEGRKTVPTGRDVEMTGTDPVDAAAAADDAPDE